MPEKFHLARVTDECQRSFLWLFPLIFLLALAPYLKSAKFDFVNYDDQIYVYENASITNGLSLASAKWAFGKTVTTTANWHPLTFISLMTDVSLFGVRAGPMHLHNAILHACNSVLLFLFLFEILLCVRKRDEVTDAASGPVSGWTLSGAYRVEWAAAALGAIFWAVHPLRAESVAWIASRKDVLCVFWYLLGMLVHLRGLTRQSSDNHSDSSDARACVVAFFFLLAFMSKPTAMVFPVTAMILEYTLTSRVSWRRNQLMVYLMVVFVLVTLYAQGSGGAIMRGGIPSMQLLNAVAAIGQYVTTTIVPTGLSFFYPYETSVPLRRLVPGILFLCVVADLVLRWLWPRWKTYRATSNDAMSEENRPPIPPAVLYAAGGLWFLVALAPVVGLVQVGMASCADRYTYLSSIGLALIVATAAKDFARHANAIGRWMLTVAAALWIGCLFFLAVRQVGYWKDTVTLLTHAIQVTRGNHVAHCNLAAYYFEKKDFEKAVLHIRQSAILGMTDIYMPRMEAAMTKLAGYDDMLEVLNQEVRDDDPHAAIKYHALGMIASYRKLDASAEAFLRKSVALGGAGYHPWELLGYLCERQGRYEEAEEAYEMAIKLNPERKALRDRIKDAKRNGMSGQTP